MQTERTDRQVSVPYGRGIRVEKSVVINATPEQLYTFWRNFENLPRFMHNLDRVEGATTNARTGSQTARHG